MRWYYKWRRRLASFFKRSSADDDLTLEIEQHVEMVAAEYEAEGLAPDIARKKALREFGNVEALKEECRDSWGMRMLFGFWRDFNLGQKVLRKEKGFSIAVIATLAVCIGGNVAIFTMFNQLLIQPLPFPAPDQLVEVYNTHPHFGIENGGNNLNAYTDYRNHTDVFESLALAGTFNTNFEADGSIERITAMYATDGFFDVFKTSPFLGDRFSKDHMLKGHHHVAILSHSFWERAFGGTKEVVGQRINLDSESYQILGVASPSIEQLFPNIQLHVPYWTTPGGYREIPRFIKSGVLYGRLTPGISIEGALAQIARRDKIYYEENPYSRDFVDRGGHVSKIGSLQKERVKDVEPKLYLLQSGALFVLFIGCVNIVNLMLVRYNARQTELAVRSALGARVWTLMRQMLTESLLLVLGGFTLGVIIGWGGIQMINTMALDMLPPTQPFQLKATSLYFALGSTVTIGIIITCIPFPRVLRSNLVKGINQQSRSLSSSKQLGFVRSSFAFLQVALAFILLVGAGLLLQSFSRIVTKDFGLDPDHVTTMSVALTSEQYKEGESVFRLQNQILNSIESIPKVSSVSIARDRPFTNSHLYNSFKIFDYDLPEGRPEMLGLHTWVSPDYFETLDIDIIKGSDFGESVTPNDTSQIIIDKQLADRYFPGEDPIGKRLGFVQEGTAENDWPIVVGVAETAQHSEIGRLPGAPFMYHQFQEYPIREFSILINSELSHEALIPILQSKLKELDPNLPIFDTGYLNSLFSDSLDGRRAIMMLLGLFALVAVILSAIGIYGMIAYNVSQQRREIGMRTALGATKQQLINYFLKRGFINTLIGLLAGLIGALTLSRFIESLLYDVKPTDPIVYLSISVILLTVAMLAYYLPVRKALQTHPMEALRAE